MTRRLYRLLLRLHPQAFRERFAQEMLWIFDQAHQPTFHLLDAALSLVRQHASSEPLPQPMVAGFGLLDTSPALTPRRLAEASVTATLILAAMLLLLAHPPRATALIPCPPGTPRAATRPIQAPSRIEHLATTATPPQSGDAQINHAVAGALHVLRSPTGYCADL
jgi:hypothetical protein